MSGSPFSKTSMSVQILLMQRYLTNNFSQSESFQPLERMHFNNLIQPLEICSTIRFSNHWAWQKYAKKFNWLKICSDHWKFQPLKSAKILANCKILNIDGAAFYFDPEQAVSHETQHRHLFLKHRLKGIFQLCCCINRL